MDLVNHLPTNIIRMALMGLLAGVVCLGLAACGGEAAPSGSGGSSAATATQPPASTGGGTTEVKVGLTEWKVEVGESQLPAGKIKFTVINDGAQTHNLTILQGDK